MIPDLFGFAKTGLIAEWKKISLSLLVAFYELSNK
jgi:hypothetical protein